MSIQIGSKTRVTKLSRNKVTVVIIEDVSWSSLFLPRFWGTCMILLVNFKIATFSESSVITFGIVTDQPLLKTKIKGLIVTMRVSF